MVKYVPHLLVVDDDQKIRDLLQEFLEQNGYYVSIAKDADEAKFLINEFEFDLFILDVMLPKQKGTELASQLKNLFNTPILMLTAMGEIDDKIKGLEAGADDYLVKPFDPRELILRIKKILLRTCNKKLVKHIYSFSNVKYDKSRNNIIKNNQEIKLTTNEIYLMTYLTNNIGKVVSRETLAQAMNNVNERTIDVQIIRLRAKIEDNPKYPKFLKTIRGKGYILYEAN